MERGISSGTDTEKLVELTGLFLQFAIEHFKGDGLKSEEVDTKLKSISTWFVIVDELHSRNSLVKLMNKYELWKGVRWLCTPAPGGNTVVYYGQLEISQNA